MDKDTFVGTQESGGEDLAHHWSIKSELDVLNSVRTVSLLHASPRQKTSMPRETHLDCRSSCGESERWGVVTSSAVWDTAREAHYFYAHPNLKHCKQDSLLIKGPGSY